jgi:uncharacterized protein YggU (UPF0235/DUF167 family)
VNAAARVFLRVRVVPRASRSALAREADGRLRVHLGAPPVEGAANRALIALLAERLALPRRTLTLARGEHGRDKLVCVEGVTAAELEARLDALFAGDVDKGNRRG